MELRFIHGTYLDLVNGDRIETRFGVALVKDPGAFNTRNYVQPLSGIGSGGSWSLYSLRTYFEHIRGRGPDYMRLFDPRIGALDSSRKVFYVYEYSANPGRVAVTTCKGLASAVQAHAQSRWGHKNILVLPEEEFMALVAKVGVYLLENLDWNFPPIVEA